MATNDPFGNDDLFSEFERPAPNERDWDDEMAILEAEKKADVNIDADSGRKHLTFNEESDSESETVEVNGHASNGTNVSKLQNQDSAIHIDPSCCLRIAFLDKDFSSRYKSDIERFISSLIADMEPESEPETEKSDYVECFNFYRNFLIDCKGCKDQEVEIGDQRPIYEQVYRKALPYVPEEEDEDACPQTKGGGKRGGNACWNCGGKHSLAECPEPRNAATIAQNRQLFMQDKDQNQSLTGSPSPSSNRYHADEDPRFKDFKAGRISDELREALGLRQQDLPPYIYRMRQHGYPPGHLIAAQLSADDIAMFDKHGRETNKEGQTMEDGEVDDMAAKGGYDYNKIVEYPGFNVPVEEGYYDYNHPPMNEFQMKENLPVVFGDGVFRMNIDGLQRDKDTITDREEEDMDLSAGGTPPKRPRLTHAQSATSGSETDQDGHLSLEELIRQKNSILHSLKMESSTDANTTLESETDTDTGTDTFVTPTIARSKSVLISMGTPILNKTPTLPDSDTFRKNITEHIPYENLPNATGMFSKMMKVMDKVKDALSQMKK